MTDKELYQKCKKFGMDAIEARRKFTGLLPEVLKRELHRKKGFSSIYEFAAKLAGLSRGQVDEVLRLERKFKDKPVLHELLIQGKVSVPKMVRVASIATEENQDELVEKVQTLSKSAIDVYVKDRKNDSNKQKVEQKSLYVQTLKLDEDIEKQLAELQQKGININNLLRKFLREREEKIEKEIQENEGQPVKTRYIKVKTRQLLTEKFGTKCCKSGCPRPAEHIHHMKPFAKYKTHDPKWLRPLCKAHHELAHEKDKGVQEFRR